MNYLPDLSLLQNRRTRKRRVKQWELVPEEQRPRCKFCGSLIPFVEGAGFQVWMARNVCSLQTDTKEVKCMTLFYQQNNIKLSQAARDKNQKKNCPICGTAFTTTSDEPVCSEWDCGIAKRKCKQWGIPLENYHDEVKERNRQQRLIDATTGTIPMRVGMVIAI